MNLLSLAPEIQVEMSRPRSWAADNGAAAQDLLSSLSGSMASTCRLRASFGPLLNQPPFELSECREDIEYQFSGSTGGIDGSPKGTLFVTILSFLNNASH